VQKKETDCRKGHSATPNFCCEETCNYFSLQSVPPKGFVFYQSVSLLIILLTGRVPEGISRGQRAHSHCQPFVARVQTSRGEERAILHRVIRKCMFQGYSEPPFFSKSCVNEIAGVLAVWMLSARTSIILPVHCGLSPSRSFKRMLNTQRFYCSHITKLCICCRCTEGLKSSLKNIANYMKHKDKDSEEAQAFRCWWVVPGVLPARGWLSYPGQEGWG